MSTLRQIFFSSIVTKNDLATFRMYNHKHRCVLGYVSGWHILCGRKFWKFCLLTFTYLGPLPLLGHRPRISCLHTTRSCAVFSSSFQFFPVLLTSAFKSLLQLLHGLPLFLFPGGFQVRACRVMLLGGFLKAPKSL